MKFRFTKKITKYNFTKSDARKSYYGWDNTDTQESEDKLVDVESARAKLNEILRLADENGYEMYYFDVKVRKTVDKSLRKEVRFELKEDR